MTGGGSHRLVRVTFDDRDIFLDTGSGWPTCFTIEKDFNETNHKVAGVNFQVVNKGGHILVRRHNGDRWLDMNRIFLAKQDEATILNKFDRRYKQRLPFNDELRLSWLEEKRFFRLVNNILSVFESGMQEKRIKLTPEEILRRIEKTTFPGLIPDLSEYLEKNT